MDRNQIARGLPAGWNGWHDRQAAPSGRPRPFGAPTGKKPVVLVAVPYDRVVCGPFFQAVLQVAEDPALELRVLPFPGTVIHISRSQMIEAARRTPDVDFLLMVDSDQTFHPHMVSRLVAWDLPVVAPVICQRLGPAIPVCYRVERDAAGREREGGGYAPLLQEVALYLRCFSPERFGSNGGTVVLPLDRDQPHPNLDPPLAPDEARALESPLLECDAVGTGMVLLRRDVLDSLEPDGYGLFTSFADGAGEDFNLMKAIRAKGHRIFVDRGCVAGHLVYYARGAWDLLNLYTSEVEQQAAREDARAALPPAAPDLVADLRRRAGEAPQPAAAAAAAAQPQAAPDWWREPLPGELPGEALAAAAA